MDMEVFLRRVLPSTGPYIVASSAGKNLRHEGVPSIQAMVRKLKQIRDTKRDAYYATATFSGSQRKKEFVVSKRAFYLDLDVGENKPYSTAKNALTDFKRFVTEGSILPPTLIVSSGHGVHIYWLCSEDIAPDDWEVINHGLQGACDQYKLHYDTGVTKDSSRLLRPIDTVNYKDPADPQRCSLLYSRLENYDYQTLYDAFGKWIDPAPVNVGDLNSDLTDGLDYATRKYYAPGIIADCPAMGETHKTRGADQSEVLWHQWLTLLAFCEDGHDYIHDISRGYTGYSSEETEQKFKYKCGRRESIKPPLCTTFEKYMPSSCAVCPHKGSIKSPISLGVPIETGLPHGYVANSKGIWLDADKPRFVCPHKIQNVRLYNDIDTHWFSLVFDMTLGSTVEVNLTSQELMDPKALPAALAAKKVVLDGNQRTLFQTLMVAWVQKMQRARQVRTAVRSFGWVSANKKSGFSAGDTVYWDDNTDGQCFRADNVLVDQYQAVGNLAPWKTAVDYVLNQNRRELDCAIASAFAAPLVLFSGVSGVLLSIVSTKSGTGKSTALKLAQSVWGDPIKGVHSLNDTTNSVIKRMGMLRNLPAYWDELRMKEDVRNFVKLIFQLGQGKEKSRLNSSATMQETGTWNTLITVASNESIVDHVAQMVQSTDAGARRVFEITVNDFDDPASSLTDRLSLFGSVNRNYGQAGAQYAKWLANNKDYATAYLQQVMGRLEAALNTTQDERFWLAVMSCLIAGASFAKKLNLVDFDIRGMTAYLIAEFKRIRAATIAEHCDEKSSAKELLTLYLNIHRDNIMVSESYPGGRGSRSSGAVIVIPTRSPVVAQLATKPRKLRIGKKLLSDWLYSIDQMPTRVIESLKLSGAKECKASIGVGLPNAVGGRIRCLDIPLTNATFSGWMGAFGGSSHDPGSSSGPAPSDLTGS